MKIIKPSVISGNVTAPASKSMMQRAVACALLSDGQTKIVNPSFCDDSKASMNIAKKLGAVVKNERNCIVITGGLNPVSNVLNCGEAGLCIRMFSPIAGLCYDEIEITGTGSLLKRPISMIESPLKDLGVGCDTNNGFPPVKIHGPLKGGKATVDGSISSQFLTGLLLALPTAENDTILEVKDLKSKPYIDMTLKIQAEFGVSIENEEYKKFIIPGNQKYCKTTYNVEGDWSGASFMLVAGAISGEIIVSGIDIESNQADIAMLDAIEQSGAYIEKLSDKIIVKKEKACRVLNLMRLSVLIYFHLL